MIINKKATSIGTTMTWFIGIGIIIFFIVIYLLFINLFQIKGYLSIFDSNSYKENYRNYFDTKNSLEFISMNKDIIDKWIDGGVLFNSEDSLENSPNKEYDDLYKAYTSYLDNSNMENPYFYIRTGKRGMEIQTLYGSEKGNLVFDSWVEKNGELSDYSFCTEYEMEDSDYQIECLNRVFITTKNGNLGMVIFYDKN